MILPLLVLIALNLSPRQTILENWAIRPAALEKSSLVDLRPITWLEPWHARVWDIILNQEAFQQNWQLTSQDGEAALTALALSDSGRLLLGDAYLHLGKKQQALQTWLSVSEAAGPLRYQKRVNLYRSTGQYALATQDLDAWIKEDPQNGRLYYQKALIECLFDPQQALSALDQALRLDFSLSKQVKTLKQALATTPGNEVAGYDQVVLGRALGNLGEWDLAYAAFQQAVTQQPAYAEGWAFLGEAQHQMGEDEYPTLARALVLDPNSISAQSLTGMYWLRHERPDLAYSYFYKLSLQEPQQAIWRLQTGDSLAKMGQPLYAMVHYQKALNLDPNNPQIWRAMVSFCLQNNLEVRRLGLPAARHLVLMTPDDPQAYDLHGKILLALKDDDDALQAFQRGLEIDPQFAQLYLDIGLTYIDKQRNDEAFPILSRAEELAKKQNNADLVLQAQRLMDRLH